MTIGYPRIKEIIEQDVDLRLVPGHIHQAMRDQGMQIALHHTTISSRSPQAEALGHGDSRMLGSVDSGHPEER